MLSGELVETCHSVHFSERLEIGEQIGDIVIFEHEDRHFTRMADLNSTLERARYHPFRQTVGRTTKARGIRIGRNTIIKRVTAGAVRLRKGPALGCTFGESVRMAISYASRDEERSCKDEQTLEHNMAPFPPGRCSAARQAGTRKLETKGVLAVNVRNVVVDG